MPKISSKRRVAGELKEIKKMIRRLERTIDSDSSSTDDFDEVQSEGSMHSSQSVELGDVRDRSPLLRAPTENDSSLVHLLKEHPNTENIDGPAVHEELTVRWLTYLKEGLPVETRKELVDKYKTPINCKTLNAPTLNEEIKSFLPSKNVKNDQFLANIQGQIGASLSALGSVLTEKLNEPNRDLVFSNEILGKIVDACQLMANTHYTLTLKRKFEISPHLNEQGRLAANKDESDEWLFGKDFLAKIRSSKEVKKAAEELLNVKKADLAVAGPSGLNNRLNYQRQYPRPKFKEERVLIRGGKMRPTRRYQEERKHFQQDRGQVRPHPYKREQRKTHFRYRKQ